MQKIDGTIAASSFGGGARLRMQAKSGQAFGMDLSREAAQALRDQIDRALAVTADALVVVAAPAEMPAEPEPQSAAEPEAPEVEMAPTTARPRRK